MHYSQIKIIFMFSLWLLLGKKLSVVNVFQLSPYEYKMFVDSYSHEHYNCLLAWRHRHDWIVEHGALTVSITAYGFQQLKLYIKFCKRSKNTHRFIKGITIFLQFIWKVGQVCFLIASCVVCLMWWNATQVSLMCVSTCRFIASIATRYFLLLQHFQSHIALLFTVMSKSWHNYTQNILI